MITPVNNSLWFSELIFYVILIGFTACVVLFIILFFAGYITTDYMTDKCDGVRNEKKRNSM